MRRILPVLALILIALTLSLYADGHAGADSREHRELGAAVTAMTVPDDGADGNCHDGGCHNGSCIHSCCSATGMATLPVPDAGAPCVAAAESLRFPANSSREGLTLRPVTGPPKLSV
jgi:hypothetical protein